MFQKSIIALGAGLAAGILFVIPTKGTMLATLVAVAAPLPVMIAALGFGPWIGLSAVAVGTVAIGALVGPSFAAIFALSAGLPSTLLAFVALRRRPGAAIACAAGVSAALALAFIAYASWSYGSYQAAAARSADALAPLVKEIVHGDLPLGFSARDFAHWMIMAMPAIMAAWGVLTLALNLWLAGRVVQISGLLPIAWPNVPDGLRLPRLVVPLLGLALAACAAPVPIAVAASAVAAAFAVALALQGYGAVHAMTRGRPARPMLLAGLYLLTASLMPWPALILCLVGVVDCLAILPRRPLPSQSNRKSTGERPWK